MQASGKIPLQFDPGIQHPLFMIRNRLLKALKKVAPSLDGKLVDLGCGLKPYESLFNVTEYVGVEYSGEGETYLKEKTDVFYDGKTLPFADNSIDSVFSSEVFEHIFNLPDIMKELNRVMKSGGKILITCPFTMPEHETPVDYARYTSFAIVDIFEKNGFKILHYEKTGNFIEAVTQLRLIYWDQSLINGLRKIPVVRTVVRTTVNIFFNCLGILSSKILPDNRYLYLNNVVLAEKI